MIQSPILRVLSTFRKHRVKALLVGGQACIVYGAAEFSRDIDFAVLVSPENLDRLNAALRDLDATRVYVPSLDPAMLRKGHACHFRCGHSEARDLRIDIMARMRGVDSFDALWKRRRTTRLGGAGRVSLMSLPDLVKSKKTQRDKDWPMIRRLVEADIYRTGSASVVSEKLRFWLLECRTPEILCSLAARHGNAARKLANARPLLRDALAGSAARVQEHLAREEKDERVKDAEYWKPLRKELEMLRHRRDG